MTTLIADCETDGLLPEMTRLWCVQIGDSETDEVTVYADQSGYPPIDYGIARLAAADRVVFHNGMGFDVHAIGKVYPGAIDLHRVFDTLVACRMLDPEERKHSLEAHGERLGKLKGTYTGNFDRFDDDLVKYAIQDIHVTRALYHKVRHVEDWGPCFATECLFAYLMSLQEQRGFLLDVPAAEELAAEFREQLEQLTAELCTVFPPIAVPVDKVPFVPKRDDHARGYVKGVPVVRHKVQDFNPGSRHQVAARLQALGWVPKAFGKDGTPTLNDTILTVLSHRYPQCVPLAKYFIVQKKLGQISDGKTGWLKAVKKTGRVHGYVNSIGCAPGRCSHNNPNLANVNKKDARMRGVWIAAPGFKLVGVDAKGLQARACAHYLSKWDGGEFAKRVADVANDYHVANQAEIAKALDTAVPRDGAKRGLYACWFGAQDPKLGWTVKDACHVAKLPIPKGPDAVVGKTTRAALNKAIVGFAELSKAVKKRAKERGYLRGPDGRHIPVRSQHSALVFLMQGAEAAVMKLALVIFHFERAGLFEWEHGVDFGYVANVHDEVQIEVKEAIAEQVGAEMADCIKTAGQVLRLKCPLAGDYHVGSSWAATH